MREKPARISPPVIPRLQALHDALDGVTTRDSGRLRAQWRRLASARGSADPGAIERLGAAIEASNRRRMERAARVPRIRVDESLPIAARADEIVELIRDRQVVVLAGETGSGKTTQLPKLCLAAGRGPAGMIGCTQPRRIAARTVARRVAAELGSTVGDLVGFQVRFTDQVSDVSLVKFMTDGILLAETQSDPWLSAYDTIILDEAHERSLNIDFLLGYLKRLLRRRRDLKLIVTSATIDTARFAAHFGGAPVVAVEGRAWPVEVRWRPPPERGEANVNEAIVAVLDEITAEDPRGDVLVFLPGEREIRDAHLAISRRRYRHTEVLALYARLSAGEQDRVFHPGPQRRIVLATNVAETSLTVPRIRYVIDTGTARVKRYGVRSRIERLHVEPVSQAAADQRKGRCGRVGPGVCYRLYGDDDYVRRPRYTDPEILRASLAGVILRMLSLGLGDVAAFPFVDAPDARAIGDGQRRLLELQAVRLAATPSATGAGERGTLSPGRHELTEIGRAMARLPVDVALGRMLIEARSRSVSREMLVIVAFLSIVDPRERPAEVRAQADAAHARFADPHSDFLGILKLWDAHDAAHAELTQARLRDWCRERFLSFLRMREWRELHRQLLLLPGAGTADRESAKSGEPRSPAGSDHRLPMADRRIHEAIHRCLLSGWPTQVGRKDERGQYRSTRERGFVIFPGSALAKSPPPWLLAGQILDLGKVYALGCARVEPAWIEQQAAHLVRRSWRDPHWSRRRGAVVASEQVALFGLVLVENRSVVYGAQDPEAAHEVFLREALAACALDIRAGFVRANARVLDHAREIEAQRRRGGLLRSDTERTAFFRGKLPATIHTASALDAWYRGASRAEQEALHWSLDDLLAAGFSDGAGDYPRRLDVAGHGLRLEYRFVPGDPADGVTVHVPLAALNALGPEQCDWLVPGLWAEKAATLIRGLPKGLRRHFVPAPDFAAAFVEATTASSDPRPAFAEALAAFLSRVTGVAPGASAFDMVTLPPHLRMRIVVHDDSGAILAEGRDLATLQEQWRDVARAAFSRRADAALAREDVVGFDVDEIPQSVLSVSGLPAFPALVDLGDSVALRVFERADEAAAEHRRGIVRLLDRALAPARKQARRQLPITTAIGLRWVPFGGTDALREDLVAAAQAECIAAHPLDIRRRAGFDVLVPALARELFPAALRRLELAQAIVERHAELVPWLEPPLLGFASANHEDMRAQLDALLAPGFLRDTPAERLAHYPRYLQALRLRGERLRVDPVRDQARMLTVQQYERALAGLRRDGRGGAALEELRWLIEELRVSLFAQELGTAVPVSPKRLARMIEAVGAAT
jgi:ATP-dependent helicase HrpA